MKVNGYVEGDTCYEGIDDCITYELSELEGLKLTELYKADPRPDIDFI